jgi:hypothetical protein
MPSSTPNDFHPTVPKQPSTHPTASPRLVSATSSADLGNIHRNAHPSCHLYARAKPSEPSPPVDLLLELSKVNIMSSRHFNARTQDKPGKNMLQ